MKRVLIGHDPEGRNQGARYTYEGVTYTPLQIDGELRFQVVSY